MRQDKQECQRCGRGIPQRRRDTGFCSNKCAQEQKRADDASAESERISQLPPLPPTVTDVSHETAYGTTVRLSSPIRVF